MLLGGEGARVLVHVGFAMGVIDEVEAQRTLELIRRLAAVGTTDTREVAVPRTYVEAS